MPNGKWLRGEEARDRNHQIAKDIRDGMDIRKVADKYGLSVDHIYKIMRSEGTPVRIQPDRGNGENCNSCTFKSEFYRHSVNPILRYDILKTLKKAGNVGITADEMGELIGVNPSLISKVIEHLKIRDGYNVIQEKNNYKISSELTPMQPLNIKALLGKDHQFGVVSDTHLCNKHSRLDALEAAYDVFAKRGIKQVLHSGNIIDGEFKGNMYELLAHGVHDQAQYMVDHYPQRDGITTYFLVEDCHTGWYQLREGINIGWYLQNWAKECGRNDLVHIGYIEQDVVLKSPRGDTRIRLIHPGGGTPYALSYPSQKMVESFQGGDKPNVLIMGHYHKFDVVYARDVLCIQPGCLEDQTSFMRKNKLAAHVGFMILTIGCRVDGVIGSAKFEWFPFYDVKYHQDLNSITLG
jgi:predicted phosphodiesterase